MPSETETPPILPAQQDRQPIIFRIPWSHPWCVAMVTATVLGLLLEAGLIWGLLFNTPGHTARDAVLGIGITTVVVLVLFVLPLIGIRRIRLVLAPGGIAYHAWGYTVRSPWENIARVGEQRAYHQRVEGFILRRPALTRAWWMRAYQRTQGIVLVASSLSYPEMRRVADPALAREGTCVPIPEWLGANWRDGPLGQALRELAPQVRIDPPRPPSKRPGTR
jgi:hypothetical protein